MKELINSHVSSDLVATTGRHIMTGVGVSLPVAYNIRGRHRLTFVCVTGMKGCVLRTPGMPAAVKCATHIDLPPTYTVILSGCSGHAHKSAVFSFTERKTAQYIRFKGQPPTGARPLYWL